MKIKSDEELGRIGSLWKTSIVQARIGPRYAIKCEDNFPREYARNSTILKGHTRRKFQKLQIQLKLYHSSLVIMKESLPLLLSALYTTINFISFFGTKKGDSVSSPFCITYNRKFYFCFFLVTATAYNNPYECRWLLRKCKTSFISLVTTKHLKTSTPQDRLSHYWLQTT